MSAPREIVVFAVKVGIVFLCIVAIAPDVARKAAEAWAEGTVTAREEMLEEVGAGGDPRHGAIGSYLQVGR
jgi:hypothetical protein